MNEDMGLERMLTAYMADEVADRAPARLVDDVLSATSRVRPAPRWLALLQEPPMRIGSRVAVGMPTRGFVLAMVGAALLLLALTAAIVAASLLKPPEQPAGDDWPMFHGDATRAGLAATGPVGYPVVQWQFHATGAVSRNISIVGDLVYASSDDGLVHALARADGIERWSTRLPNGGSISGPAVLDGAAYVVASGGSIHALDAQTGAERWISSTTVPGASALAGGGGAIFAGSADGDLVAFEAATGAERWRVRVSEPGGGVNAPAFDGTDLYVGTEKAGFISLDAATGAIRWRVDTGTDQTATATVADGVAYIGSSAGSTTGHLRAIDAATGEELWTLPEALYSPTVSAGVAYAGSTPGDVVAIDTATGRQRWRAQFRGIARGVAFAEGVIYVPADGERRVYALDASTGGELWHLDLDSSNLCCIAVARGSVFVGTSLGTVYAIGGDGATVSPAPIVELTPSQSATGGPAAQPSLEPTPAVAEFIASLTLPGDNESPSRLALDPSRRLWGTDAQNNRFGIFSKSGAFIEYWGKAGSGDGEFNLVRSNGDGYGSIAFEPDGSFFVLDAGNLRIQKFDARREPVLSWGGFGTDPGTYGDPVGIAIGPDRSVYVLDDVRGVVERYDEDGKLLVTINAFSNARPGFNKANNLAVDTEGNVYVSQIEPNQVVRFDPSGNLTMTFGDSGPGMFVEQPGDMAIDQAGRLFVTHGGPQRDRLPGVEVFDAAGTYIGGWGPVGNGDGEIGFPSGLLLDGKGGAYVADAGWDSGNPRIEHFRLLPPIAP